MVKNTLNKKPRYCLDGRNNEFVIEEYNFSKPFANSFPGIAAKYGIPMWVFYVNRGQAIASFGTKDKDHAILEFYPANKSWQLVSSLGFRTFIKQNSGNKSIFYEPFHNGFVNLGFRLTNKMRVSSSGLKIEEDNLSLGLKVRVEYFTIPNDSYAGLARIVTIKNTSKSARKIQLLDGLPQIIPFGTSNLFLKKLSRTVEAWMNVENLEKGAPFYKLSVDPTDRPEVVHIKEGNFYLSFHHPKGKTEIIKPIIDPGDIFGPVTDFSCPYQFLEAKKFIPPRQESVKCKTPCGFSLLNLRLRPGEEKTFYTVIGCMRSREMLNASISKIASAGYLGRKKDENQRVIEELQRDINTQSSSKEFDLYAKQTYLDNIMRGGYPAVFKNGSKATVFYLYSRKHGDLERDYNKFQLEPAYFSQGNGNYRDLNQNRRCDVWFNPQIRDENITAFFSLIQADGFNPLVIKGASFMLKDTTVLKGLAEEKDTLKLASLLTRPFSPGEAILFLEDNRIKLKVSCDEFLNILLSNAVKIQEAEYGEGFWTDHWHYNLDLLESYLGVYPETLKEIIFQKLAFTFFDNTETVKPRSEKYVLKDGRVWQFHAVTPDNTKREMIRKRGSLAHLVRTKYGKGEIYETSLINKLLCLLANKLASLDSFGCGIEMEANKPNWFDALNGLPGLLGSSLCETFELKRLVLFIKDALQKTKTAKIYLTEEIREFLTGLDALLKECLESNSANKDYLYWDKSSCLKEEYRQKTKLGFSGDEVEMPASQLYNILNNALRKIDNGIAKAYDAKRNVYYSYFINQVAEYELIKDHFVKPAVFKQIRLPLFLEGQMHALRLSADINEAKKIYGGTKKSELFDKPLKMYKVTASLKGMPEEIGRVRVFTPGWLEHESVWLHMEYKYLLELLKNGLHEEFYQDFKNALIPFQKPQRYGRSILENSSFLVSSAFPDRKLHGNGFVARLSGSTVEFLEMWLVMNLGREPFFLNAKAELNLRFRPILAGWLFERKGDYSFNFLSKIRVTYHNPKRKDTFGKNALTPKKIVFNDKNANPVEISSDTIPSPYAEQIRSCSIKNIDIYLQ